jgi:hypothetical protein
MPVSASEVSAMASVFVDTIGKMSAKEREKTPTMPFAERFNNILVLAKEAAPDVDSRLWPEPIKQTDGTTRMVNAHYGEIETYASQIVQLLPKPSYA